MKAKSALIQRFDLAKTCASTGNAFGPGKSFVLWIDEFSQTLTQKAKAARLAKAELEKCADATKPRRRVNPKARSTAKERRSPP